MGVGRDMALLEVELDGFEQGRPCALDPLTAEAAQDGQGRSDVDMGRTLGRRLPPFIV